jgi:hypothetical protein
VNPTSGAAALARKRPRGRTADFARAAGPILSDKIAWLAWRPLRLKRLKLAALSWREWLAGAPFLEKQFPISRAVSIGPAIDLARNPLALDVVRPVQTPPCIPARFKVGESVRGSVLR